MEPSVDREFLRTDTCALCGECADLYVFDDLPEHLSDLEGVCCLNCGTQHLEETERQRVIDREAALDRAEGAVLDAIFDD